MKRLRFKRKSSLRAQLAVEARQLRDEAESYPPGHKRNSLLRKARRNEVASDVAGWLISPGK
ncbi:hypothetical protein EAS62_15670 [Bradyrhizobium zhanjiangense]|uniref:DUF3175 domain-containing protein n=1 Tax=Bradyrhizobium zhanjiangense TaxID=1325107 RepID=A0ABY0DLJ3_9BRAD|nr:hypothetical protein EAS62_15670 [Bradyrhizobium zhanjiangense]